MKTLLQYFNINKASLTDEYKRIISLCAYNRKCYLIVEPDPQICNRYCEIICMSLIDFEKKSRINKSFIRIR